jgi:hypothetical protein
MSNIKTNASGYYASALLCKLTIPQPASANGKRLAAHFGWREHFAMLQTVAQLAVDGIEIAA